MHKFLNFILRMFLNFILRMFRTVPMSIIRSSSLYAQQWFMSSNLYDINHCCVYSKKTLDDGQRNCPKHVDFYSEKKFEKLVHLVGFIIKKLIMMHCHINVKSNQSIRSHIRKDIFHRYRRDNFKFYKSV
jgi:hypothetical protein